MQAQERSRHFWRVCSVTIVHIYAFFVHKEILIALTHLGFSELQEESKKYQATKENLSSKKERGPRPPPDYIPTFDVDMYEERFRNYLAEGKPDMARKAYNTISDLVKKRELGQWAAFGPFEDKCIGLGKEAEAELERLRDKYVLGFRRMNARVEEMRRELDQRCEAQGVE